VAAAETNTVQLGAHVHVGLSYTMIMPCLGLDVAGCFSQQPPECQVQRCACVQDVV
jgi:hypothetical protein